MKLGSQAALTTCVLLSVLLVVTAGGSIPNVSAAATVSLSYTFPSLQLNVQSSVGVGSWQVEVNIPSGVSVGSASGTGFMAGASQLSNPPTQYRWFNLQANGQTAGSLTIPLTVSGTYTITVTHVDLKDVNNNIIPLDLILPITANVGTPNSTSTNTSSSTTSPIMTSSTIVTSSTSASSTATTYSATVASSTSPSATTSGSMSISSLQTSSVVSTLSTPSYATSVAVTAARTTTLVNLPESPGGVPAYVQVSSNSTLTALQFDASRRVLNFTASGPTGSVGFAFVVIGKSLIDGPPMVLVDDGRTSLLSLSVTSNSTHYFIGLFYSHSTHNISIGGGNPVPEFHGDLVQIALVLVSVLLLFQGRAGKHTLGRLRG